MKKTTKAISVKYFNNISEKNRIFVTLYKVFKKLLISLFERPFEINFPKHSKGTTHNKMNDYVADPDTQFRTETLYEIGKLLHAINRVEESDSYRKEALEIGRSYWDMTEELFPKYNS